MTLAEAARQLPAPEQTERDEQHPRIDPSCIDGVDPEVPHAREHHRRPSEISYRLPSTTGGLFGADPDRGRLIVAVGYQKFETVDDFLLVSDSVSDVLKVGGRPSGGG